MPSTAAASKVLEYNSMAVALLQEGRYHEGEALFRMALKTIKERVAEEEEEEKMNHQYESHSSLPGSDQLHCLQSVAVLTRTKVGHSSAAAQDYPFAVFGRAILVHLVSNEGALPLSSSSSSSIDLHRLAAVILYNSGLSHHLAHIAAGSNESSRGLISALKLYQMSMAMMANVTCEVQTDDLLLLLALQNNMAIINGCFTRLQEMSDCLELLENCYEAAESSDVLSLEDTVHFYTTLLLCPKWSLRSAPAA